MQHSGSSHPPHTPRPAGALEILLSSFKGVREQALSALERTKQHSHDPIKWARKAQEQLEHEAAHLEERRNLAAAMAVSLREDEQRKAAEKPVGEWNNEQLLERYESSPILQELLSVYSKGNPIFDTCLRKELIRVLEFERQACKWYPGSNTLSYFRNVAQSEVQAATTRSKKRVPPRSSSSTYKKVDTATPDVADMSKIVNKLSQKVQETEKIVYSMPSTCDGLPSIFKGNDDSEDDEVEILSCPPSPPPEELCLL